MDEKGMHGETAMFIISDVAVRKETWQCGPFPKTRWSGPFPKTRWSHGAIGDLC